MKKLINRVSNFQDKFVDFFFEQKIKTEKRNFERKQERPMEDDELEKYKFKLFTVYSLVGVVLIIILLSIL